MRSFHPFASRFVVTAQVNPSALTVFPHAVALNPLPAAGDLRRHRSRSSTSQLLRGYGTRLVRFRQSDRALALDTRNVDRQTAARRRVRCTHQHRAADRVTSQAEVVLGADFRGVPRSDGGDARPSLAAVRRAQPLRRLLPPARPQRPRRGTAQDNRRNPTTTTVTPLHNSGISLNLSRRPGLGAGVIGVRATPDMAA